MDYYKHGRIRLISMFWAFVFVIVTPAITAILLRGNSGLAYKILIPAAGLLVIYAVVNIAACVALQKREFKSAEFRRKLLDDKENFEANHHSLQIKKAALAFFCRLYLFSYLVIINAVFPAAYIFTVRLIISLPEILSQHVVVVGLTAGVLVSLLIFAVIFTFIKVLNYFTYSEVRPDSYIFLSRNEFPRIWEIADEAKKKCGKRFELALAITQEDNVSITKKETYYIVSIGVEALRLLNAEELHTVFLHEFGHLQSDRNFRSAYKKENFSNRLENLIDKNSAYPKFLFLPFTSAIINTNSLYFLLSSYKRELKADKHISEASEAQCFINAVAKLNLWLINRYELPKKNILEFESFPEDFFAERFKTFLENYEARKEKWDFICKNQLPSKIDTHPSLPERMKNFGMLDYFVDFAQKDEALAAELKKIEDFFAVYAKNSWEEEKRLYCQETKSIIDSLESGKEDSSFTPTAAAYAYFRAANYDKALTLYEDVLKINPKNPEALYSKGLILLDRYDNSGINYLFEAMKDMNYCETAYMRLGLYLNYMGLKEEKEKIIDDVFKIFDSAINIRAAKRFKLKKHTLGDDKILPLVNYLKQQNIFSYAFIFNKKTLGENSNSLLLCFDKSNQIQQNTYMQNLYMFLADADIDIAVYLFHNPVEIKKLFKKLYSDDSYKILCDAKADTIMRWSKKKQTLYGLSLIDERCIMCYSKANVTTSSGFGLQTVLSQNLPSFMVISINEDTLNISHAKVRGSFKSYFASINLKCLTFIKTHTFQGVISFEFAHDSGNGEPGRFFINSTLSQNKKAVALVNEIMRFNKNENENNTPFAEY